ncbi:MAG: indole-3-glycerol phosphate synthase TrpC [Chloroflexota bacterium]
MTVLDEMVAAKRIEIAARQAKHSLAEMRARARSGPAVRPFRPGRPVALIAEVKRRSPSRGDLALDIDPVQQAIAYQRGGASAVSVLTDEPYFGGSFHDLELVRAAIELPVLCKDFILEPYQVFEARSWGTDILLLVVAALEDRALRELHTCSLESGMQPLVEVHDQHDLARALALGAGLIGINNRDLSDFSVNLLTTEYLAPLIPESVTIVSESGIATPGDVKRVRDAGASVVLVGEALMRAGDPAAAIASLLA